MATYSFSSYRFHPSQTKLTLSSPFSVDDVTDTMIQRIVRQKFAKHTIIAVAHKLDTIVDFDKVAVLDHGELKEFDNPGTLLANEASAFSKLYARGGY